MRVNNVIPKVSFSSIVVKNGSNAMGLMSENYQFSSQIIEKYPNLDTRENVKKKTGILNKFGKFWSDYSGSAKKNIVLETNPDIDSNSIKSIVASIEYVKKGKTVTIGTVKDKETFFELAEGLLNLKKPSSLKRLFHK